MSKEIDPNLSPGDLNSPSENDLDRLSQRVSFAARNRLMEAGMALHSAKLRSGDTTPWQQLVQAYRDTDPVRVEVEVVDDAGQPRFQIAYIQRGFGLKGDGALLFGAVAELARALELIEKERELNKENGRAGGRPSVKDEIRQSLERAIEKHGKKMMEQSISWILDRVRDDWYEQHGADASPPSDNTIRSVIEVCLPDHPKVKKKNFKKAGS